MSNNNSLEHQRKFISPIPGDTVETIAARELAQMPLADAIAALTSWNLHIFLMRQPHGLVTGSDVVFVEAPQHQKHQYDDPRCFARLCLSDITSNSDAERILIVMYSLLNSNKL